MKTRAWPEFGASARRVWRPILAVFVLCWYLAGMGCTQWELVALKRCRPTEPEEGRDKRDDDKDERVVDEIAGHIADLGTKTTIASHIPSTSGNDAGSRWPSGPTLQSF